MSLSKRNTQDEKRRQRFWRRHVAEQSESGLSKTGYCRKVGLKANQFFYWQKRLAAFGLAKDELECKNGQETFVPVELSPTIAPWMRVDSLPATASPSRGGLPLEIFCPQGFVLRIPAGTATGTVSELIQALARLKC